MHNLITNQDLEALNDIKTTVGGPEKRDIIAITINRLFTKWQAKAIELTKEFNSLDTIGFCISDILKTLVESGHVDIAVMFAKVAISEGVIITSNNSKEIQYLEDLLENKQEKLASKAYEALVKKIINNLKENNLPASDPLSIVIGLADEALQNSATYVSVACIMSLRHMVVEMTTDKFNNPTQ
jgi:hypothetical protein